MKVCGHCSLHNSAAKNYCDRCGAPLAPGSAPTARPQSAASPAGDLVLPRTESAHSALSARAEDSAADLRRRDRRQNLYFLLALLALAAGGGAVYLDRHDPAREALAVAGQYLDALSRQDLPAAYALLTTAAQAHCPEADFRTGREGAAWTWSDAKIVRLESEAATIKYLLRVPGQPPREDFLAFQREGGRWRRPHNGQMLQKAQDALDRSNPDLALILAQEAARIDPRDPAARAFLCEAVYSRGIAAETERQCLQALDLSARQPSQLSAKSLRNIRAILGDTYKNSLHKYPEALAQYDAMLASPEGAETGRCEALLASADTRLALGRDSEAGRDLQAAAGCCAKPADLDFIRQRQARLPPGR